MKARIANLKELETLQAIRNKELVWRTKDGKVIFLQDMTNVHLDNVIKMLKRDYKEHDVFTENYLYGLTMNDIC